MSIELFEHNRTAYESAVAMLAETGKAAVIQPKGTGKSFIGFKLCEDNHDKTVCWISLNKYIFKTQLENLEKSGAEAPQNIKLYTYKKLTCMTDKEISDIRADIFIIDKFHRGSGCGQSEWARLFNAYPNAPVLGLSDVNTCCSDSRQYMTEKLFGGNIVSEITLGEAIVLGILKAPLYVSAFGAYERELERQAKTYRTPRFAAVREKAGKYLDELRCSIEKADSPEKVFENYIPDKCGKYVVFCADKENLDEMVFRVLEWFGRTDKSSQIYKIYKTDFRSSVELDKFKADRSSNLRLLFCIDILNDGVCTDDLNGIIMSRSVTSPSVYRQQLSFALASCKNGTPVIFDIINNFENLYSIGELKQEMACAAEKYRSLGENGKIINDKFEVVGTDKECIRIFDKLRGLPAAAWDEMYGYALEYYSEYGDLEVPENYKIKNGVSLRSWLYTQRRVRKGEVDGVLTDEQIKMLDDIGMRWQNVSDANWEKNYAAALEYYNKFGNLNPGAAYVTENGVKLGVWLKRLKNYRKSGVQKDYLTEEHIKMLDDIGMIWDVRDHMFEKNYAAALDYFHTYGNLDISERYVAPNGVKLGVWLRDMRKAGLNGTLDSSRINRLNEIGMQWDRKPVDHWENGFEHAKAYFERNGHLDVPASYACEDKFRLGAWLIRQRERGYDIDDERRKKLDSIGMLWTKRSVRKKTNSNVKSREKQIAASAETVVEVN